MGQIIDSYLELNASSSYFGTPTGLSGHPADFGAADGASDPVATPPLHQYHLALWAGQGFSAGHQSLSNEIN